MGGNLHKVAVVARLRKKDLKFPDKIPPGYDQNPFKLHGKMDLAISFVGNVLTTSLYIILDTKEPLLLSEDRRCVPATRHHPIPSRC